MNIIKQNKTRIFEKSARAFALIALFLIFVTPGPTFALTQQEAQEEINQLNKENQSLGGQVNQKKQEATTISGQINALSSRISITQSEISKTSSDITRLLSEIGQTEIKIKEEEAKLKERQGQLGLFVAQMYEDGQQSDIELIAASKSFSDFVNRSEYIEQIQLKIKDETDKIIVLRNSLKEQSEKLAKSKSEAEFNKQLLVARQSEIQSQRSAQNYLLSMTNAEKAAYEGEINSNNRRKGAIYCIAYPEQCKIGGSGGEIVVRNSYSPYYNQLNYSENYLELTYPWNLTPQKECWDCTISNYGCLITSLAMVRSYFGNATDPVGEARKHSYDRQGYMQGWDFAGRPRVSISKYSIGNYLEAGKPVIVELDLGEYHHFIALFEANNGQFYANDPAFRSGTRYKIDGHVVRAYSY